MSLAPRIALMGALLAPLALATAPALAGTAKVTFVAPETYTDVALFRGAAKERDRNLRELEKHIQRQAERLPANQVLEIQVTDVDLAGRYFMRAAPQDIRIMTDVTPPVIKLRYALTENGQTLKSGEERLLDLNYLNGPGLVANNESLRYDKRLLSDWFRKTFPDVPRS